MALSIVLSQTNSQISKATIFTDSQGDIRSAENPLRQSGQQILRFIVSNAPRMPFSRYKKRFIKRGGIKKCYLW